jgi:hypothetical protein
MKTSDAQERTNAGTICLLLSGVFAASILLPLPASNGRIAHLPSVCLFYNLTGLPCPGCGLTRSFVCLGHGHWREALHWHPLGPLLFLVFALLWLRCGLFWGTGVTFWPLPPRTVNRLGFVSCLLVLLTGIARIGWLTAHHLKFG